MGTHRIPLSNAETDTFLTVPVKLDACSAPTDVTTLNVSTSAHGLCPKLPNDSSKYFNGAGNYTAPTTFGTTEGTFCEGDDSRLSNSRTPTSHATSHKSGGADSIKLDELSSPTDISTLNASTTVHGLCPKGANTGSKYLRDDITWTIIDIDGGSP